MPPGRPEPGEGRCAGSRASTDDDEQITIDLPPGTYVIHVYRYSGTPDDTQYSLTFSNGS